MAYVKQMHTRPSKPIPEEQVYCVHSMMSASVIPVGKLISSVGHVMHCSYACAMVHVLWSRFKAPCPAAQLSCILQLVRFMLECLQLNFSVHQRLHCCSGQQASASRCTTLHTSKIWRRVVGKHQRSNVARRILCQILVCILKMHGA